MAPYGKHRQARPFEQVSLYSGCGWLRCGDRMVRYLPERRMSRIRDHIYVVMRSGLVPKGTEEWQHLEDALKEVHDGKVYHCRGATEGGRGARGGRGGGGTGVVIRS